MRINTLRRYNSTELRDRLVRSMRSSYRPRSTIRKDGYGLGNVTNRFKKMPPRKRRTRNGTLDKYGRNLRTRRARDKADAGVIYGDNAIVYDIMRQNHLPQGAAALIATHVQAMDDRTQRERLPREAIARLENEHGDIVEDHVKVVRSMSPSSARRQSGATYKRLRTNRKQIKRRKAQLDEIYRNIYGYRKDNRLSPVLEGWSDE